MLCNKAEWDKEIWQFFRALIAFRRSHIDFMRGVRRRIHLDLAESVYGCQLTCGSGHLAVLFNLSSESRRIKVKAKEPMFTTAAADGGADGAIIEAEAVRISAGSAAVLTAVTFSTT